jgi:tetratricopeptide (TPR) repeat protein
VQLKLQIVLFFVIWLSSTGASLAAEGKRQSVEDLIESSYQALTSGNYPAAYQQAMTAYQKAIAVDDQLGLAEALRHIGHVHSRLNNLEDTIKYYQQALNIFRELAQNDKIALCLNGIALTFLRLDDQEQALEFGEQAYRLITNSDSETKITVTGNYAYVLAVANQSERSDRLYDAMLTEIHAIESLFYEFYYFIQRGDIKRQNQDYKESIEFLRRAVGLALQQNNLELETSAKLELAKALVETSALTETSKLLIEIEPHMRKSERKEQLADFYQTQSDLYEQQNDFQQALVSYRNMVEVRNNYRDDLTKMHANIMAIESQLDDTQQALDKQALSYQTTISSIQQDAKNKRKIIIALMLVCIILGYLWLRALRKLAKYSK